MSRADGVANGKHLKRLHSSTATVENTVAVLFFYLLYISIIYLVNYTPKLGLAGANRVLAC